MNIADFSPDSGWPGTIIKIAGEGFPDNRDENRVEINGVPALVVEAAYDRLVVVAGEQTTSGKITITVGSGGMTAESSSEFMILPYPSPNDLLQSGAPCFFHGPQKGTPQTGVANQPVLVLLTYPTDHDPGSAANRSLLRNDLIARFDQARQYWNDASYGSTTWNMTYADWLPLPRERRFYFWQSEDIDDARRELFLKTTRSLSFDGTRIFHGEVSSGWIPVDHPNPLTFNFLAAINTGGSRATALRLDGNRLYAGTEAGFVFVFDVTNLNAPVQLGSLALPNSYITAIDISGTNLLVAGREGGIHLVDAANPAAMTIVSTLNTGANWAMATKVEGSRGYVGTGASVRVFDLSGTAALVQIADVPVGNWVTGLDVVGSTCAVATDGDGLNVFEVTGGGIVNRSAFRNVLRIRQIKLVGNLAYLAANAGGLIIVDLSNLSAPIQRGQLMTTKPCFNVAVSGNEAILALGANDLLSVTVTNPDAPTRNGSETPSAMEPDLGALQNALKVAIDSQNLIKDANPLFVHALRAWLSTPGNSANPFQGIMVVVNGPFLRGQSWTANGFNYAGDNLSFNNTKGVIYIAYGAGIARIAHEIGHWLGMWDIYTEWYADGTYLEGTAGQWCLSGSGDRALFCGHQINDIMDFYETAGSNQNVLELAWSPITSLNEPFDIVAHDVAEDTDPNRIHILKLKAAEGLYYYVEVRQKPVGQVFDQSITIPPGESGLVVVTRVTQGTTISNTFERPIMLFGELTVGEQVVDAGRNLIIRVESRVQDRPLIYRVRVQWNQPIPGNPDGKFDMTITPWNTDIWETVDVWVDSPRNNPASGPEYEFYEGNDRTKPRLNGDRPWVHRKNKIYARIRNTGPQPVGNVYVTCYVTSPPGIGDNGQWATLATKEISFLGANSDYTTVDFDWAPSESKHTCLKIAILPKMGEIEPRNNMAQENVGVFDSAAASSHRPVVLEAEVRSPFIIWRKVDVIVRGLPLGWHAVVDKSWVWLEGHGSAPLKAIIWTDRDSTGTTSSEKEHQERIPPIAYARVEGWTSFEHRYLPIGGFLAIVKAVKKVKIDKLDVNAGEGILKVDGCLDVKLVDIPITIEVTDEKGNSWLFYSVTDDSGCFHFDSADKQFLFHKGTYTMQVFVTAGGKAAETESDPIKVEI